MTVLSSPQARVRCGAGSKQGEGEWSSPEQCSTGEVVKASFDSGVPASE
jgi:hypothetical protein